MPRPSKRRVPYNGTLEETVGDAMSQTEELHSEMEEQCEGMESNEMEHLPRYEVISQTRDNLEESLDYLRDAESTLMDCRSDVREQTVAYIRDERKAARSRPGRRDNIDTLLCRIIDALDERIEEIEEMDFDDDKDKESEFDSIKSELDEIKTTIESAQSSLQEAEFPSMFSC